LVENVDKVDAYDGAAVQQSCPDLTSGNVKSEARDVSHNGTAQKILGHLVLQN
jgi:hypothetical protein